jgi:hypothetical protein
LISDDFYCDQCDATWPRAIYDQHMASHAALGDPDDGLRAGLFWSWSVLVGIVGAAAVHAIQRGL